MGRRRELSRKAGVALPLLLVLGMAVGSVRAEVIEEIAAWVNDDIVTRSDLAAREREIVQGLVEQYSGAELDQKLAEARGGILRDLITEKLLIQKAERLYDMKKMEEAIFKNFKESQKITNDQDLEQLLANEGMSVEDLKKRLVEYNAPRSVVDYEVKDKVVVTDAEVEAYYAGHPDEFSTPGEVTFREIVFLSEGRGLEEAMTLARETAEQIRAGADMDALAREKSEAPSKPSGGLIGPFRRGELNPAIEAVVFTLEPGKVSDPIEAGYGAHLVRVEKRTEPHVSTLEEVRDRITDRLSGEKFTKDLEAYVERIWSTAVIEVRTTYLDHLTPDYRRYVTEQTGATTLR